MLEAEWADVRGWQTCPDNYIAFMMLWRSDVYEALTTMPISAGGSYVSK